MASTRAFFSLFRACVSFQLYNLGQHLPIIIFYGFIRLTGVKVALNECYCQIGWRLVEVPPLSWCGHTKKYGEVGNLIHISRVFVPDTRPSSGWF